MMDRALAGPENNIDGVIVVETNDGLAAGQQVFFTTELEMLANTPL